MHRSLDVPVLLLATCFLGSGCGDRNPGSDPGSGSDSAGKPKVLAVNYPLAFFAERIGGEAIEVDFPVEPGVDPAFWKPTAEAIGRFQSADLILKNGADFAKWIKTTSLPDSIVVDTSTAFTESLIVVQDGATHRHGDEGEHSHEGVASTTWLDFGLAIQHAAAVRDALIQLLPEKSATFETNFAALRQELETLDGEFAFTAQSLSETPLVASHPVYQYAARRYGLRIRSLLWEPEIVPDEEAMKQLAALLEGHPASVMIWEAQPAEASVAKLASIGVSSVVSSPSGNRPPEGGDFLGVMRSNIEALKKAADSAN